jgi:hypothetical protein
MPEIDSAAAGRAYAAAKKAGDEAARIRIIDKLNAASNTDWEAVHAAVKANGGA